MFILIACKTEKRVESNTLFIRKNQFSLADSGFWQKSAFKTAGVLLLPSLQVAVHLYDSGISTHVLRTYLSLLIIIGVKYLYAEVKSDLYLDCAILKNVLLIEL